MIPHSRSCFGSSFVLVNPFLPLVVVVVVDDDNDDHGETVCKDSRILIFWNLFQNIDIL